MMYKVSSVLHHTHHLRLDLDQKLLVRMMKMRGATRPVRDRKVQVCQNILRKQSRTESIKRVFNKKFWCLRGIFWFLPSWRAKRGKQGERCFLRT